MPSNRGRRREACFLRGIQQRLPYGDEAGAVAKLLACAFKVDGQSAKARCDFGGRAILLGATIARQSDDRRAQKPHEVTLLLG